MKKYGFCSVSLATRKSPGIKCKGFFVERPLKACFYKDWKQKRL